MSENRQKFDQLCGLVDEWREELGIPGTVIGISIGDETFTYGSGVTSATNPLQMNAETLAQIGSTTKTVTATAMMCLVEQGKLDLDAPIRQYLPDFKVKDEGVAAKVTVKHLITHSAGWIGDVFTDTGDGDDALAEYVRLMENTEQLAPPDRTFSYNNAAFCIAGRIIEVVTGLVYETAIKQLIFEPLGMDRAFFFPKDVMTYRFVVGHRVDEEQGPIVQRPWPIPRSSNPAGGIVCDIKNLLTYGRYHLGDGSPMLTQASLDLMHSPQFPINDQDGSMGLAWFVGDVAGTKTLQHGGSTFGQQTQLLLVPEHSFVYGAVTNAGVGTKLNDKIEKWALKEFLGLEDAEPEPIDASPEELAPYVGLYSRPAMDTEIRLEDGQVIMQITSKDLLNTEDKAPQPPPATMKLCGKDQMVVMDGMFKDLRVEFLRDDEGNIDYLRLGLRINPRVN